MLQQKCCRIEIYVMTFLHSFLTVRNNRHLQYLLIFRLYLLLMKHNNNISRKQCCSLLYILQYRNMESNKQSTSGYCSNKRISIITTIKLNVICLSNENWLIWIVKKENSAISVVSVTEHLQYTVKCCGTYILW